MLRPCSALLPALLLLLSIAPVLAQTVPPTAATAEISAEADAGKWQLRLGLNAARVLRHSSYQGLFSRVPLSVGAEYALSRRFTLYGQVDADAELFRNDPGRDLQKPLLPTAALGVGVRYYYNQDGRARHNRARGAFIGNYLAVELHTEKLSYPGFVVTSPPPAFSGYYATRTEYAPTLNLLWGMQRRISRNFLFDFNAGVGLGAKRSDAHFGGYSSGPLNLSTQINLGLYFGR